MKQTPKILIILFLSVFAVMHVHAQQTPPKGLMDLKSSRHLIPNDNPAGRGQIFVMNHDGSTLRQLTQDKVFSSSNPSISGDGSRIVFESDADLIPGSNPTNRGQIFVMNHDGSALRQLTRDKVFSSFNPSISGDGGRIVFESDADLIPGGNPTNRGQVFVMNRDGSALRQLTRDKVFSSSNPSISSDGSHIAFHSNATLIPGGNPTNRGQVFVINSDGSDLTQLTNNRANHSQSPSISGDGKIIVFQSWANLNRPH